MSELPKAEDHRAAEHPINPLFIRRWSPRAMSGEPEKIRAKEVPSGRRPLRDSICEGTFSFTEAKP